MIRQLLNIDSQEIAQLADLAKRSGLTWHLAQFQEDLARPDTIYVWHPQGFIACRYILDEAEITNLAVEPAYRGQGLASLLWQTLMSLFGEKGVKTCFLEVRASNQIAKKFYEKNGFQKIGQRKNYYQHPLEDADIYRWEQDYVNFSH